MNILIAIKVGSGVVQRLRSNRELVLKRRICSRCTCVGKIWSVWQVRYMNGQTDDNANNSHSCNVGVAFIEDLNLMTVSNGKTPVSFKSTRNPPSSYTARPFLERVTRPTSGEQAGPSCWESGRCHQTDQTRFCGICANSMNLHNIAGREDLLFSTCR